MRHYMTIRGVEREVRAILGDGFDIRAIVDASLVVSRKRKLFKYRLARSESRLMRLAAVNYMETT